MKMIVFVGASVILKGGFNFANSWMGQEWSKLQLSIVGKGYFGVMESWFWCWPFLFASIATAMNIFGKDSLLSYLIWAKGHFLCWQLEICHISWLSLPSPLQWNEANNKMFTIYIYYIHFIVYIASYLSIYLSVCIVRLLDNTLLKWFWRQRYRCFRTFHLIIYSSWRKRPELLPACLHLTAI